MDRGARSIVRLLLGAAVVLGVTASLAAEPPVSDPVAAEQVTAAGEGASSAAGGAADGGGVGGASASLARRVWHFLGVFHPMVVHFPIALLTLAALVELGRATGRVRLSRDVTWVCLVFGAASAVLAALLGWANAAKMTETTTLATHRWIGLAMAGLAIVLAGVTTWQRYRGRVSAGRVYLAAMVVLAAGVGFTGHQGGKLVYGDDYIERAWRNVVDNGRAAADRAVEGGEAENPVALPDLDDPEARVDFAAHVEPILKANCLECHGPRQADGRLRLHEEAKALAGGRGGPAYEPGDPERSLLYELITSPFEDERMPPADHAAPLSDEQIAVLHRWIKQGARWDAFARDE